MAWTEFARQCSRILSSNVIEHLNSTEQGRRQKNFQGGGGQQKKIPKNSKQIDQKIALLSL